MVIKKVSKPAKLVEIRELTNECREILRPILDSNYIIYYLDECMFTVNSYKKVEFAPKHENICCG